MVLDCRNCGAPLEVSDHALLVDCRFCDVVNRVQAPAATPAPAPLPPTHPPYVHGPPAPRVWPAPPPVRPVDEHGIAAYGLIIFVIMFVSGVGAAVNELIPLIERWVEDGEPRTDLNPGAVEVEAEEEAEAATPRSRSPEVQFLWVGARFAAPEPWQEEDWRGPIVVGDIDDDGHDDFAGIVQRGGDPEKASLLATVISGKTFEPMWVSTSLGRAKEGPYDGRKHAFIRVAGEHVVASTTDRMLMVLDLRSGHAQHVHTLDGEIEALCPRGTVVVVHSKGSAPRALDPRTGKLGPTTGKACAIATDGPFDHKPEQRKPEPGPNTTFHVVHTMRDGDQAYALVRLGRRERPAVVAFAPTSGKIRWTASLDEILKKKGITGLRGSRGADTFLASGGRVFVEIARDDGEGRYVVELSTKSGALRWVTEIPRGDAIQHAFLERDRLYLTRFVHVDVLDLRKKGKRAGFVGWK